MSFQFISMVHNNPGEAPFQTRFNDPKTLREYGCTGQVFRRNLHAAVSFVEWDAALYPEGSPEADWLQAEQSALDKEIAEARQEGLDVFYHVDLFVLPRALVERAGNALLDEQGRISLEKPATLEVHRLMLKEMFQRFPDVTGLIVRVGETYLHDTPHHGGNGAVPYGDDLEKEQRLFVQLIQFLREEICVRHNKRLIYRTWDCFPDRFHASRDYYLSVTNQIEPHENLIFSMKHTMLDFWRYVKVNPAIGTGKHPQIVEVQCQREYEGKGAFPNYFMDGVLEGFPEDTEPRGLRQMQENPLFRGVYAWPRGGGWFGPYLKSEIWCDIPMFVLGRWLQHPELTEPELLTNYGREKLGLDEENAKRFYQLCHLAEKAVLKGRYCEVFDRTLNGASIPTNIWFRDDRLAGPRLLRGLLETLDQRGQVEIALDEKRKALKLWQEVVDQSKAIAFPDEETAEAVRISARYGQALFCIALYGWEVIALDIQNAEVAKRWEALWQYEKAWQVYRKLGREPLCPTLFEGFFWAMPGEEPEPGLDAEVEACRARL